MSADFSHAERDALIRKIQDWMARELDLEIGGFDAGFLLDFFLEEIGPAFYNRALEDAQAILDARMETLQDALRDLEKPIKP